MGFTRYWIPPSKEEVSWNSLILSFGIFMIVSFIMYMLIHSYKKSNNLSIALIGVLWLYSLVWFLSSIKSKYLTKNEFKRIFNLKVIFHPATFIFGFLFGILGGIVFAAIIEVIVGIQD